MEYIKLGHNKVSRLGFGCMRLPQTDGNINYKEALDMAEYAIENGINYFDTAYIYHNGKSEEFIKKVIEKFGREKIFIADKLPMWLCHTKEDMQRIFDEQLVKLGTNYIDYYLIHSLYDETWEKCQKLDFKDFIERNINSGKIKHIGFSFHDEVNLFKEIIDAYNWDFCQIQFNYLDTEYQAGIEGYNYAQNKGIPVIIMEPIRGGSLASIPDTVRNVFNDSNLAKYSDAHLALKYVSHYENNKVILSGMRNINDMKANIELFNEPLINTLTPQELELYVKAKETFFSYSLIGCTGCNYCKEGCPANIYISELLLKYNDQLINPDFDNFHWYKNLKNDASKCIRCGACERVCPQGLKIIEHLKTIDNYFKN